MAGYLKLKYVFKLCWCQLGGGNDSKGVRKRVREGEYRGMNFPNSHQRFPPTMGNMKLDWYSTSSMTFHCLPCSSFFFFLFFSFSFFLHYILWALIKSYFISPPVPRVDTLHHSYLYIIVALSCVHVCIQIRCLVNRRKEWRKEEGNSKIGGREEAWGREGSGKNPDEIQREAQIQLISHDTLPPEEALLCTCTV